ncbi:hypothetical protein BT96DRAFT_392081 [Gymnopus androsaceus JB14]|uniref:Uncharacterized protein n=1 Tax=Gymnopus androsaceus JB14 TaxID=1447944 RepID=A0A6A4GV65_9AGAR|nr:hypothetical protein BT96DRAFT_392081 [Gymnopus androsaceus JB14]
MAHDVTIVELNEELDTKLLWFSVPKLDTRVHLKAKIKNASEYALIPGKASVYIDGTFIARTDVPAGPDEFRLQPGSRLLNHNNIPSALLENHTLHTFHWIYRYQQSQYVGYYQATSTFYSQRITVHNTKRVSIEALKLLNRVPVNKDEKINVNVVKPAELSLSSHKSQNQAVSVPSSQMTTVKAKSPSSQGSKKRDESEKPNDTTSFTSSKADTSSSAGIGK